MSDLKQFYKLYTWALLFMALPACAQNDQQGKASVSHVTHGLWTLDISADNKYFATGGDDSLLRIYKSDFTLLRSVKLIKPGMIRFISWHPKKNIMAIATLRDIWMMNAETGEIIPLEGKKNGSRTTAWNHSGELLASADHNGIVNIWDSKGKLLRQIFKTTDDARDSKSFLGLDWHPSKNILVTVGDEIRIYDT
jgi:WD40 repeat protein